MTLSDGTLSGLAYGTSPNCLNDEYGQLPSEPPDASQLPCPPPCLLSMPPGSPPPLPPARMPALKGS
jgi:hypothetical protein